MIGRSRRVESRSGVQNQPPFVNVKVLALPPPSPPTPTNTNTTVRKLRFCSEKRSRFPLFRFLPHFHTPPSFERINSPLIERQGNRSGPLGAKERRVRPIRSDRTPCQHGLCDPRVVYRNRQTLCWPTISQDPTNSVRATRPQSETRHARLVSWNPHFLWHTQNCLLLRTIPTL